MRLIAGVSVVLSLAILAPRASATTIDFETDGSGAAWSNGAMQTVLATTYQSQGLTIGMSHMDNPRLGRYGDSSFNLFTGYGGASNTLAPAYTSGTGQWFLGNTDPLPQYTFTFGTLQASAGATILDIDGAESWLLQIESASGAVLSSQTINSSSVGGGDAGAVVVSFSQGSNDIKSLVVTAQTQVGAGIDNVMFSRLTTPPPGVPEPSSLLGLGASMAAASLALRRRAA